MATTVGPHAPTGYGYSRRCPPGDSKSTDRRRLLTDRNAYIAFLEAQAERRDVACEDVEALDSDMRQLVIRVEQLEESVRSVEDNVKSVRNLEETVHGALRAATLAQENALRAGDNVCAGCRSLQDEFHSLDGRLQSLTKAFTETQSTMEAEMARTRNEVSFQVQDLGHYFDERIHRLHSIADEGASSVIREAQTTCVRLADDALGAAEASQKKVEEYQRWSEAALEVLRVDFTGLRAELAGLSNVEGTLLSSAGKEAEADNVSAMRTMKTESVDVVADEIEARLAGRLGQQILQLSEVVRRVVQAQATITQQWSASPGSVPPMPMQSMSATAADVTANSIDATFVGDRRRRTAIDDLYKELRQLERHDTLRTSAHRCPSRS